MNKRKNLKFENIKICVFPLKSYGVLPTKPLYTYNACSWRFRLKSYFRSGEAPPEAAAGGSNELQAV